MNRKDADPVTGDAPGVTVTDPGNAAPDPVTGRVTPSPGTPVVTGNTALPAPVPMSAAARAGTALRYHAGELWLDPGRLLHDLWHGKAETMAEHRAYVESRAWVPEGMSEAAEKAVAIAGIIHHLAVAYPVKALAKALESAAAKLDHAADRAITLYGLIAFLALLVFLIVHL